MVSRWAFEALAVEQHTRNQYMAPFFDMEKQMGRAKYNSDLLVTELEGRIDHVAGLIKLNKTEAGISNKLDIIRNEIQRLNKSGVIPPFAETEQISLPSFNPEVAARAKQYLEKLKDYYLSEYGRIRKEKDSRIIRIRKSEGSDFLYAQKMKYHNKSL